MLDLIRKAACKYKMFENGDIVTVALSGGADSVALLHALYTLRGEFGITVNAAHLNHSIRGEEADRDQKFVQDFCEKLGIILFCEKSDVPLFAKENHLSLELAAREVRYDFLKRVAKGKIATAHSASDNLETLLFNLTRGSGLKGMRGIPAVRDNIVRPIILCSRADVEKYCEENGLEFVTDSTNLSDDYSRNKIRHNVVPLLKQINPSVEASAIRSCDSFSEDSDYLDRTAKEYLFGLINDNSLFVGTLCSLHKAVSKRVLKQYFEICYPFVQLENHHINELLFLCENRCGKINLPSDIHAQVTDDCLYFYSEGENTINQFYVSLEEIEIVNNLFSNNLLDCDKIVGKLTVRTREEGDSIRLYNRGCTKSLKKLYTECKIPVYLREDLPVISDEKGVVWVHNIGVAQRVAISNKTKKAFKIEVIS